MSSSAQIERIVRSGDVRCLFQPIVDLDTREPVGFEALTRGPAGSELERPDRLFAAAREAGLVARLDALCQTTALTTALEQGLHHPWSLFINTEPETLDLTIPELLGVHRALGRPVPIVVEVTERSVASRPAELLRSLEQLRDTGARIAVDDAGADVRSLALMPLLTPDVIKLDLRLVQQQPSTTIARIVTAVTAQAERSGATILAEGIETEEHLQVARSLGATLGQGWLFGRPEALPTTPTGRRGRLHAAASRTVGRPRTPFEICADGREARVARKPLLIEMSKHLETEARGIGALGVLLSTFQHAWHFTPDTERRYRVLADEMSFVAAIGEHLSPEPVDGVRGALLSGDDPVRGEWDVVVLGPHFAAALVARDLGDDGPDRDRRFEYVMTYERQRVIDAARALMTRVWADDRGGPTAGSPSGPVVDDGAPAPLSFPSSLHLRALAAAHNGVTIADARATDQPIVYVNGGFERLTGYRAADIVGRNCRFLQGPDTDETVVAEIRQAIRRGTSVETRLRNYRADGSTWWNQLTISPVFDATGRLTHYIGIQSDVTAEVEATRQLEYLVGHDELTGLPNRRALTGTLAEALDRGRERGRATAVLFVDLDGFKTVNDEGGHQRGDELLRGVADRLRTVVRSGDVVARRHGDEFVIVLTDLDGNAARTAARVADASIAALSRPLVLDGQEVRIGASVGVALAPADAGEPEALLRAADGAMYAAKDAGKGMVRFASDDGIAAAAAHGKEQPERA